VSLRTVAGSSKVVSVHAVSVRWFVNGHVVRGARSTHLPLAHSTHGARVYARVAVMVNGAVLRVVRTSIVRVR
jgi:flagellar biosynthesis regulator FlbT